MATHGYGDIPLYVVPDVGEPRMVQANQVHKSFLVLKVYRIPNGSKWKKKSGGLGVEDWWNNREDTVNI
jgi:hypothetical protein